MPKITAEDSDIEDVFEETVAEADTEAKQQLNGELEDEVNKDEDELALAHDDEDEEAKAKADDIEDEEDDEEGADGEEYTVESISDHQTVKGQVLYWIKWKNYPAGDNTWEPEDHLIPHSRAILAAYWKKIGGRPEQAIKKSKSKQSLRAAPSSEDLPAAKRQRRNGVKDEKQPKKNQEPEPVGSWLPTGDSWEHEVEVVETIERSPETHQLMAYVRFKNKKRTKMSMEMVYKHCPRPMLRFYEEHLKFNPTDTD